MNKWFPCKPVDARIRMRLFCFPYAGGGVHVFNDWKHMLPDWVQLVPLSLPGRDVRIKEQCLNNLSLLLDELEPTITPYLDRPYAFFGHSMGAQIAYELAHRLAVRDVRMPERLFLSGRVSPTSGYQKDPIHHLPEEELVEKLKKLNGVPTPVLENRELMELVLPVLRADFKLIETWTNDPDKSLDIPITALGGVDDMDVTAERLFRWKDCTNASFDMQLFPGDHFYLRASEAELLARLAYELDKLKPKHNTVTCAAVRHIDS
jgi:medium-chain acyl-[acyl-carrier-protein] hydrolase